MDFVTDALSSGRQFCLLAVLDDGLRKCLGIEVDVSSGGELDPSWKRAEAMRAPLNHPRFGTLAFAPPETWENHDFRFHADHVQLLIQAGPAGPQSAHEERFRELEARYSALIPSIVRAMDTCRDDADQSPHSYALKTIYLPDPAVSGDLSVRLWFDDPAEDIAWFGVEIHGWDRIVPFAED